MFKEVTCPRFPSAELRLTPRPGIKTLPPRERYLGGNKPQPGQQLGANSEHVSVACGPSPLCAGAGLAGPGAAAAVGASETKLQILSALLPPRQLLRRES